MAPPELQRRHDAAHDEAVSPPAHDDAGRGRKPGADQAYDFTDWSFQGYSAGPTVGPNDRHKAADERLSRIQTGITAEDAGKEAVADKDHQLVSTQLAKKFPKVESNAVAARDASATALKAGDPTKAEPKVAAFETAVAAFEKAYESTYLISVDALPKDPWKADDYRDKLSSKTVAAKLESWTTKSEDFTKGAYIKFAVPASAPHDVHVGTPHYSHVEIAGGNALSAGILRFDPKTKQVSEVENTSGGFRPSPLRNQIVLERLIALGYAKADVTIHDNPDASYQHSEIDRTSVHKS